MIKIGLFIS